MGAFISQAPMKQQEYLWGHPQPGLCTAHPTKALSQPRLVVPLHWPSFPETHCPEASCCARYTRVTSAVCDISR